MNFGINCKLENYFNKLFVTWYNIFYLQLCYFNNKGVVYFGRHIKIYDVSSYQVVHTMVVPGSVLSLGLPVSILQQLVLTNIMSIIYYSCKVCNLIKGCRPVRQLHVENIKVFYKIGQDI